MDRCRAGRRGGGTGLMFRDSLDVNMILLDSRNGWSARAHQANFW